MTPRAFSAASPLRRGSKDCEICRGSTTEGCRFRQKGRSLIVQPIVGTTSQIIRSSKWYKDVSGLGVDAIEINRRNSKLHLSVYFLEKVRGYLQDIDVSLHTATTGIFQQLESFTKAELATLEAEVDVAHFMGAHEMVFHLNDGALAQDGNKERLAQVIDHAKDKDVDLIYESDTVLQADHACHVLGTFPELGYALDLGHLNNGFRRGLLGCGIEEFISRVKDRVVYIHANNNHGIVDEHKGLNDGSLDWQGALGLLDMRRVKKIIIEVRSLKYLKDTQAALRDYLPRSVFRMV